jgi:phosphoglycolate phosphatase-like HAD superfamily hydrolase
MIYIGDETRDIEACKKINVPIIAVSWGFNSHKSLASHSPTYLINNPKELVEIAKNLE